MKVIIGGRLKDNLKKKQKIIKRNKQRKESTVAGFRSRY
jgi:hypothetical protein